MAVDPSIARRVLIALSLPLAQSYADHVQGALNHVESWGGMPAIAEIIKLIDQCEQLDQLRFTQSLSGQGTLIRADVLEWSAGGAAKSTSAQYRSVQLKLASLLGLTGLVSFSSTLTIVR